MDGCRSTRNKYLFKKNTRSHIAAYIQEWCISLALYGLYHVWPGARYIYWEINVFARRSHTSSSLRSLPLNIWVSVSKTAVLVVVVVCEFPSLCKVTIVWFVRRRRTKRRKSESVIWRTKRTSHTERYKGESRPNEKNWRWNGVRTEWTLKVEGNVRNWY